MQTLKSYLGFPDCEFDRAYRETLIFQTINTFEQDYKPDNAVDIENYQKQQLTLEQKRRLRNDIVRRMADSVKDQPEEDRARLMYDPAVMEEAFFATDYGQKYANQRGDWETNHRDANREAAGSWTVNQRTASTTDVTPEMDAAHMRFTVSPYDPRFANSDLFAEDTDEIGYVVCGKTDYNGKYCPGVWEPELRDGSCLRAVPNARDAYIEGVHVGSSGTVMQYNPEIADSIRYDLNTVDGLYGARTRSGYPLLERYIKKKSDQRDVRNMLMDAMENGRSMSDDEREFIEGACRYLSENGIPFDVTVKKNEQSIVANLGGRREIRLYDKNNPQYQGRIYDNGLACYMSVPTTDNPNASAEAKAKYDAAVGTITAQDRLNAVKYYFGGEAVAVDDGLYGRGSRYVGEMTKVQGGRDNMYGISGNAFLSVRGGDDNVVMVNMGVHPYNGDNSNNAVPVDLRIVPAGSSYSRIMPSMLDRDFQNHNDKFIENVSNNLYVADMYPDDRFIPPGGTVADTQLKATTAIDPARYDYYRAAVARNTLEDWVENAKDEHAKKVNIDDLIDKYETYGNDGYEYNFDADERIAEIQQLYWDVLSGNKGAGKTKHRRHESIDGLDEEEDSSAAVELEAFDDTVFAEDLEERKQAIRDHYAKYVEDAFGRVPELVHPFDDPQTRAQTQAENKTAGFNPTMVARYSSMGSAHSIQRNYDYIRHMLQELGDYYDEHYVKDNTYIGNEIKKDMIKFDQSTAACNHYSQELGRYTGMPLYAILDKQGQIDYNEMYQWAPSLRDKPVTAEMLAHTGMTLLKSGCDVNSIELNVDENGIIQYRGAQCNTKTKMVNYNPMMSYPNRGAANSKDAYAIVSGTIGQVFEPDENGVIIPKYESSRPSKVIVPGYEAYLVSNDADDPKPARERLRLFDWKHQMQQAITEEIHRAAYGNPSQYNFIPHTTSLNSVYRHTYDMEMTEQEYHEKLDPAMSSPKEVETFRTVITTLKNRCRFPNEYGEGSTTMAQSMLEHPTQEEARRYDYWYSDLCDNKNLRVLDPSFDGIYDPDVTGTAKTQGLVRYLADGVEVDVKTGKVTPVEVTDPSHPPQCALMKDELFAYAMHDSWDRRQMPTTMALTALRTPRNVGAAMMTLKGDTFDDGFTVSSDFAHKYAVRGENGDIRDLIPQDKMADLHGNKGVISRVVDRSQYSEEMVKEVTVLDTTDAEHSIASYRGRDFEFNATVLDEDGNKKQPTDAELGMMATKAIQKQLGIDDDVCKVFHDNPDLDVVMSPYSGMSRFNGGTVRELMKSPSPMVVKGQTVEGGMGHMNFIVVNMLADKKTHFYDEEAVSEGKGRKASGQLLWQLEAKGADKIVDEFYGNNTSAWDSFREYAIVTGLDLNEKLEPVIGYHEQAGRGEHRRVFTLPPESEIQQIELTANKRSGSDIHMKVADYKAHGGQEQMQAEMNKMGGFMEMPFPLKYPTLDYVNNSGSNAVRAVENRFYTQETGRTYTMNGNEYSTYGVPVLPPGLRSGQDFKDGTARNHDYTTWYLDMYKQGVAYMAYQAEAERPGVSDVRQMECRRLMEEAQRSAQASFDRIVGDVIDKQFNTKHNVIRDDIFTARIPASATAVASADASLKSDEIGMSEENAVKLGIRAYDAEKDEYYWTNRQLNKDGSVKFEGDGHALVWRDPLLREKGVSYKKVRIDENVTGITMNPAMAKQFDGDFDGDSYGVIGLRTKAAIQQAEELFNGGSNMLDLGAGRDENGRYPLIVNTGIDIAAKMYQDKLAGGTLQARCDALTEKANLLQDTLENIEAGYLTVDAFKYSAPVKKETSGPNGNITSYYDRDGDDSVYQRDPATGDYVREEKTGREALIALRDECKQRLDEFLKDAFDDVAVDHIIVHDEKTLVESVQRIVDSGAKGNQSKMRDFMDNVGIDYALGEDGRADASTATKITAEIDGKEVQVPRIVRDGIENHDDRARKHDNAIQETGAYKADNTALGGTSSQNGICAFRNFTPHEILELTYPTTQSILQSKHDPKDAKVKDEIVRFWGKDVWDGYKLTGNWRGDASAEEIQATAHERVRKPVLDEEGNRIPVQEYMGQDENGKGIYRTKKDKQGNTIYEEYYEKCTKDEWVAQMKGMMKALKVPVNEEYIQTLADCMYKEEPTPVESAETGRPIRTHGQTIMGNAGCVCGVTQFAEENGALLDKIAYKGRLTALVQASLSNDGADGSERAGSLAGNALEQRAKAYNYELAAKREGLSDEEHRDLLRKAKECKQAVIAEDRSGMPLPKTLIAEAAGDMQRAETGSSTNEVYRHGKIVQAQPVPLGRKDCRLTASDYDSAKYPVMGESEDAYQARKAAYTERVVAQQEAQPAVQTSAPQPVPEKEVKEFADPNPTVSPEGKAVPTGPSRPSAPQFAPAGPDKREEIDTTSISGPSDKDNKKKDDGDGKPPL